MADDSANLPAPTDNAGLRSLAGGVQIAAGSLAPRNLAEVMDFGQLMAKAGPMVGKAFRQNPGACVAITMQAMQWNMSPFAVSQKAYVLNDNIAYEAQLVTAVINAHAPIVGRPRYSYEGEGAKRRCTISATMKGDTEPSVYTSPEVGKITTKNSPLWKSDEDQQLGYYSIRAWARRYCPEVIMGVYTPDEMAAVDNRGVISSERVVDEFDQRPQEEREQDADAGGMFLTGEPKDLVIAHTNALMQACDTHEALEKVWASFKRKYYNNTTKKLSHLTFEGIEEMHRLESERIAKAAGLLPWLLSFIDGCTDFSALEEWRASGEVETAITNLSEEQQTRVQKAYEDAQEALGEAVSANLARERA